MLTASTALGAPDWVVVAAYFLLLIGTGVWLSRRQGGTEDYFLAGRRMPSWAVAISVYATATSAATFIGAPDEAFAGDLTFLSTNIGTVLAVFIVAFVFIPAYYARRVTTVYELIGARFGPAARQATSWTFMLGRVFSSGARVFIAAHALAYVLFGDIQPQHLLIGVAMLSVAGVLYTVVGGIATVIWTDVVQAAVLIVAVLAALIVLLMRVPIGVFEIGEVLRGADGGSKLRVLDMHPNLTGTTGNSAGAFSKNYTLLTALTGWMLLGVAAYGADQDLAQRLLTCRSRVRASIAIVGSLLMTLPVTLVFMSIGLLLYVFYQRPDVMGAAAPTVEITSGAKAFLHFLVHEMPPGLGGLMIAGIFAAGLSSLDSALNSMSSAFVHDFYKKIYPDRSERHYLRVGRIGVALWGAALGGFACFCVYWHGRDGDTLLQFALRVMTFTYTGLLAVFAAALLTRRGTSASAIAALATGFLVVVLMEPIVWRWWTDLTPFTRATADGSAGWRLGNMTPAFPWRMVLGAGLAFLVCAGVPSKRR